MAQFSSSITLTIYYQKYPSLITDKKGFE